MKRQKLKDKAISFEKKYGTEELLKVVLNSVTKILIKKNIATIKELQDVFELEIKKYESMGK